VKTIPLSALALLLTWPAVSHADSVNDYVREQMRKQHIPGLSLAVLKDSSLIKVRGYGFANLELHSPARPETAYQLASVTKQFVAAAIMLLVQDGKIGLDDKISTYLSDSPAAWKDITVRHLLTHTSGIKDYLNELHENTRQDTTPEKIIQSSPNCPSTSRPANAGHIATRDMSCWA